MTIAEGMTITLAALLTLAAGSLIYRHRMGGSPINLDDLLLGDDRRISKSAVILFGAFVVTSWVVAYQVLQQTLSDATFAAYLAGWVAPTLTAMLKRSPGGRSTDSHESDPDR